MRSRLNRIGDWAARAWQAGYKVNKLAEGCGVSARQLRRFVAETEGRSVREWLNEMRQKQGFLKLTDAVKTKPKTIKEVASDLGYSQSCHFSRDFKRFYGMPPSRAEPKIPPLLAA